MSSVQRTRLLRAQQQIGTALTSGFTDPWRLTSLRLLALLAGFFLGNNFTQPLYSAVELRSYAALITLAACELLVLWRRRACQHSVPMHWRLIDNVRIGFMYAVLLEAFKVGS